MFWIWAADRAFSPAFSWPGGRRAWSRSTSRKPWWPPVEGVVGDAATIALGRTFTHLLSAGLLEFVPDPAEVLVNARRHADPGARLVILYPRHNLAGRGYRRYHRRHGFAIHLFRPAAIEAMAGTAGWRCLDSHPVAPFSCVATFEAYSP